MRTVRHLRRTTQGDEALVFKNCCWEITQLKSQNGHRVAPYAAMSFGDMFLDGSHKCDTLSVEQTLLEIVV